MRNLTTKVCSVCEKRRRLAAFPKALAKPNGRRATCRSCYNAAKRERHRRNPDLARSASGRYYEKNKAKAVAAAKEWVRQNPEKARAGYIVRDAVRRGVLVRPDTCEDCGETGRRIEAHHDDYSKPYVIRWLCTPCHWHANRGLRRVP